MEIRHLELMRELAQRGTLAAVASATHRTPSALSQQLRTAEKELGVALVEPSSRGVRLTWAGQALADGADDVLAALARVQAAVDAGKSEPAGHVRIGTLPSAGAALMPELFVRLASTRITVDIEDFDVAEADFAGHALDADLVIGHSLVSDVPAGAEALMCTVVAREPLDVAIPASHPLAAAASVSPREIVTERWIAVPEGYPFATVLARIETATGMRLDRIAQVKDNRLVESLVGKGLGVGLLPRFSTPRSPDYRLVPLRDVECMRAIVAMGRADRVERRAVRAVLAMLKEIGASLA